MYSNVLKDLKVFQYKKLLKIYLTPISCNSYQQPAMTALHVLAAEKLLKFGWFLYGLFLEERRLELGLNTEGKEIVFQAEGTT